MTSRQRATLAGLCAIALWSLTVGLARSISEKVGPLAGGSATYLIGGAFCLARLRLSGRRAAFLPDLPPRYLFGCGSLYVLYLLSLYLAVGIAADRLQVLAVGLANYLWPTLTILFSLTLLGKRARPLLIPGTLAALLGVLLVLAEGAQVPPLEVFSVLTGGSWAYVLALIGAVLWALYSNLTSLWMGGRTETAVAHFMLATGVVLFLLRLVHGGEGAWTQAAAVEAAVLGLSTAVSYECWEAAMRRGDVTLVAACSYFTPLLSTMFTCLYLGILPGPVLWVGCGLVTAGSFASWRAVSDRVSSRI